MFIGALIKGTLLPTAFWLCGGQTFKIKGRDINLAAAILTFAEECFHGTSSRPRSGISSIA